MKPIYDHFLFGGDWNPEQWPEETWEHDIEMLEDAHLVPLPMPPPNSCSQHSTPPRGRAP